MHDFGVETLGSQEFDGIARPALFEPGFQPRTVDVGVENMTQDKHYEIKGVVTEITAHNENGEEFAPKSEGVKKIDDKMVEHVIQFTRTHGFVYILYRDELTQYIWSLHPLGYAEVRTRNPHGSCSIHGRYTRTKCGCFLAEVRTRNPQGSCSIHGRYTRTKCGCFLAEIIQEGGVVQGNLGSPY